MTPPDLGPLVDVHLLEVPVPLWSRAQQQTDELLREFALAASQLDETQSHHVPARLTALIDTLTADFGDTSSPQDQELADAAAAGLEQIDDLAFALPTAAAGACQVLGDMLDEADDYCRGGQYLLTLAATDEVVRFRRWYLSEIIAQLEGAAATPWPAYDGSWPTAPAATTG
jgi:hypothetical protein